MECDVCGNKVENKIQFINKNNEARPIGFTMFLCKMCAVHAEINGYELKEYKELPCCCCCMDEEDCCPYCAARRKVL